MIVSPRWKFSIHIVVATILAQAINIVESPAKLANYEDEHEISEYDSVELKPVVVNGIIKPELFLFFLYLVHSHFY